MKIIIMVLAANILVSVGDYELRKISEMDIVQSTEELTATARFSFPVRKATDIKIKKGDVLNIKLGCNGDYTNTFDGHVSNVIYRAGQIQVEAENTWQFKQGKRYTFFLKNTKIKDVLNAIEIPLQHHIHDVAIGHFRVDNKNIYGVLSQLQDQKKVPIYIKGNEIRVSNIYDDQQSDVLINLERSIRDHSLDFEKKDRVLVEAKSSVKKKKPLIVKVGEADGEVYKLSYFGITDKALLQTKAEKDYERIKRGKITGNISAFFNPVVSVGDLISIESQRNEIFNGRFGAKKVTISYDTPKITRTIELEKI